MWHVDDLMTLQVNPNINWQFVEWIKTKYEDKDIGEVKVKYGKIHPYLGMTFNFKKDKKLKIIMTEYVKKMIDEFKFKNEIKEKVKTPVL